MHTPPPTAHVSHHGKMGKGRGAHPLTISPGGLAAYVTHATLATAKNKSTERRLRIGAGSMP